MHSNKRSVWTRISTVYPFGYAPFAPGTWGSLPGVALGLGLSFLTQNYFAKALVIPFLLLVILILSILSVYAITKTQELWQTHDDKRIVIDEVVGQTIAICWFPCDWRIGLIGFLLFRFFDVLKPWPIGWVDRHLTSPFGTLLDDLLAGIFAALALYVIFYRL